MTLHEVGNVYVTLDVARFYARRERCGEEEARRELTEYLLDALPIDRECTPEKWRYRSRKTGLDITAHVVHERGLAVVVHVGVRGL